MRRRLWVGFLVIVGMSMGACGRGGQPNQQTALEITGGSAAEVSVVTVAVTAAPPSAPDDPAARQSELAPPEPPGPATSTSLLGEASTGRRFPGLARVGNVSMWFTLFWEIDNPAGSADYFPDEELMRLVNHGFTGVRLPIDPNLIGDDSGTIDPTALAKVHEAVRRMQSVGLAVVVDLHIWEPDDWESPQQVQRAEWIWKQLAPTFADHDPALTFLELYNEPGWWGDPDAWAPYELSMYNVVRAGAPSIPIVMSGPMSSWVDGLEFSLVVDDPNVVYTIHVYDPFPFTHQGADWVAEQGLIDAVGIPFPATVEACAASVAAQPTPQAAAVVTEYCANGYDEAWVRGRFQRAADWALAHGVELFLGEFGVSPYAEVEDSARWFAAVTAAADEFEIGWAVWSADAAMGYRRASGWNTSLVDESDATLLEALGLQPA